MTEASEVTVRLTRGLTFGAHTGLQDTTVAELTTMWSQLDKAGYDWISVWDHFYSAERSAKSSCFEAVSMHALLSATTERARCGVLVYNVGYRHPAVIANAAATIDHISGGRVSLGLGCGWHEREHRAYGMPFGSAGERIDRLEEAVQCVRLLLTQDRATFHGQFYELQDAQCDPKPIQERLPIIVGGGGHRTLRQVAMHSDGFNLGFVSPEEYAAKLALLHAHCEEVGRDPATIVASVNLGLRIDGEQGDSYQDMPFEISQGMLTGSIADVVEQIEAYAQAGADQVNFAVRAPFPIPGLLQLAEHLDLNEQKTAASVTKSTATWKGEHLG